MLEPLPPRTTWTLVNPELAIPNWFAATFQLIDPPFTVRIEVAAEGGRAVARRVDSQCRVEGGVTSANLRHILVDHLVRQAVLLARRPASTVKAVTLAGSPGAFHRSTTAERIAQAVDLYKQAVANGSSAPQKDAAIVLGYSTSQVSRYLKAAREQGILEAAL